MSESEAPKTKKRRLNFDYDQNITVIVGAQKKKHLVHKSFLTKSSEFFAACFDGKTEWRETESKVVELPEADAEVFPMYLQWLYTGDLVVSDEHALEYAGEWDDETQVDVCHLYCEVLQELAVLADMLIDAAFGNTVTDWIIKASEDLDCNLTPPNIHAIYASLPETSRVRRLAVDILHVGLNSEGLQKAKDKRKYPQEFLYDLLISFKAEQEGEKDEPDPVWENRCNYHIHNEKVPRLPTCD